MTTKTTTEADLKHAKLSGQTPEPYRAVIRPKRAEQIYVPSLKKVFRMDNPVLTNDESLIAGAQANGNLEVSIAFELPAESKAKAGK
jgi:hypothetical protein